MREQPFPYFLLVALSGEAMAQNSQYRAHRDECAASCFEVLNSRKIEAGCCGENLLSDLPAAASAAQFLTEGCGEALRG